MTERLRMNIEFRQMVGKLAMIDRKYLDKLVWSGQTIFAGGDADANNQYF